MSFRAVFISLLVILVLAGAAGGAVYYAFQRRQAAVAKQWTDAQELIRKGETDRALAALEAMSAGMLNATTASDVAIARLELLMRKKDYEGARSLAGEILSRKPRSEQAAYALAALGRAEYAAGDMEQAGEHYKRLRAEFPASQATVYSAVGLAQITAAGNGLEDAKKQLDALLESRLPPNLKAEVENALGDINVKILFSRIQLESDIVVQLKPGDNLDALAKKYNVTGALMLKKNSIASATNLAVGKRIIIPVNDFSLLVDRYTNTLTVFNHGKFFKRYSVRTGRENYMTPPGDYTIDNKRNNPVWRDPETHRTYPGGHPENELGTRWMAFLGAQLGIHGTIHPESIGLYSSKGCVGMLREDVEELCDYIPLKTPLKIVGEQSLEIRKRSDEYFKQAGANQPSESAPEDSGLVEAGPAE